MKNIMRFLLAAAFLAISAISEAQPGKYQWFAPANGILKGSTSTYVTQSATAADIIGLLTGTCSASVFVEGDGACAKVNLTSQVTGILPLSSGGTGAVSLAAATIPVFAGSITTGDCVKWLSATSIGDAGATCGSGGGGSGSVNSVALADQSTVPIYSIGGSPVTNTGTLTFTLTNQSPHFGLFGPASGVSSAQPTFRAIVSGDMPPVNLASALNGGVTGLLPNANLANSSITLNGASVSLGGLRTLSLASADFAAQGTTTTVLHGNVSGNPSFGAVNLATDVTGSLPLSSLSPGTYAGQITFSGLATFANGAPQILLNNSAAPLNQAYTQLRVGATGGFAISSATDASPSTVVTNAVVASRTGTAWSTLSFGNASDNTAFSFTGTGATSFGGDVTISPSSGAGLRVNGASGANSINVFPSSGTLGVSVTGPASDGARMALTDGNTGSQSYQIRDGAAATGTLDIFDATNIASRFQLTSAGASTFLGPLNASAASGVALNVNGTSGNTALVVNPAASATGIAVVAPTSNTAAIAVRGNLNAGTAAGIFSQDSSSNVHVANLGAASIDLDTNGANRMVVDQNGDFTFSAPTSGNGFTVNTGSAHPAIVSGANAANGSALSIVGNFSGAGTTSLLQLSDTGNSNGVNILLTGNGATTPSKTMRVAGGTFQILNSGYTQSLLSLGDNGNLTLPSNGANQIEFLSAPSTFTSQMYIGANGNAQSASLLFQQDASHNGYVRNQDSGSLFLGTGTTNFWNINAAGVLTNGTAPTSGEALNLASNATNSTITVDAAPWGWTTHGAVDLGTTGAVESDAGTLTLVNNAYFSTPNWTYKTTAPASYVRQDSSGNILMQTAASGTAGTTFSFLNRMEVFNNGGVAVGSASNEGPGTFNAPVLYQNNVALAASATTDTTNAANISSGLLPVARGGTGTATPGLVNGTNITVTGTWPNQTISASGGGSGTVTSITAGTGLTGGTITGSGTIALSTPVSVVNGGEGLSTATLGDIRYASAANTLAALAGNTTATKKFLTQTGTGTVSAVPAWGTIASSDVSGLAASATTDTTNASNISSGTLSAGRMPALTGDCTTTAGAVATTCTKTGGTSFAASATTDTTNATNIGSGTLSLSRLPTQTGTGSIVLSASPAMTGSPTIGGQNICVANGTNCPATATLKVASGVMTISSGSCTINTNTASSLGSCISSGTGNAQVTATGFSTGACTATGSGSVIASIVGGMSGNVQVLAIHNFAGVSVDGQFSIVCVGQ